MIVDQQGRSISQIFADDGEEGFRRIEAELLQSLSNQSGQIISTGGGIIGSSENRALLRKLGYVGLAPSKPFRNPGTHFKKF